MVSDTKRNILKAAVRLFSQNGYYGTSMSDIAGEVGITKTALYRHFAGKEEILDVILDSGEAYYEENFGSAKNLPKIPESAAELMRLSLRQIQFTMHDDDIAKYRRLFVIEQFHSKRMAELATKHFVTDIESLYAALFENMMDKGIWKKNDPELLAFEYAAPITMMIHLCDRQPEKETEALERIRRHIDHFWAMNANE